MQNSGTKGGFGSTAVDTTAEFEWLGGEETRPLLAMVNGEAAPDWRAKGRV